MQLTLETWHKPERSGRSEEIGVTRLEIDEYYYRRLEEEEHKLRQSNRSEAFIDLEEDDIVLQAPGKCGSLADCRLRVYLRDDDDSGHFHLVGKRVRDDALVYTSSVMVRTVAI